MTAPPPGQQPPPWPQQPARPPGWPTQPLPPGSGQGSPGQGSAGHGPGWPAQGPPGQGSPGLAGYGPGGRGRERYAAREQPQQWAAPQPWAQHQEWAPLPAHGQPAPQLAVAPKNPALSVLLSMLIPGLGSMVNENAGVGVAILALNIVGLLLSLVLIGIPLVLGSWIYGLVDAYKSAQRWNRAHGILS